MSSEECAICETPVLFGDTVPLLIHTKSEEGVVDYYICQNCYEAEVAPLFD